jgi:hypothetical protein
VGAETEVTIPAVLVAPVAGSLEVRVATPRAKVEAAVEAADLRIAAARAARAASALLLVDTRVAQGPLATAAWVETAVSTQVLT